MLWCSCHAQVNSRATLIFTGFIDEEVHENIILPYVPYLTDEYGDIYFEQVIIGLDNIEMLSEMEVLGPSDLDIEVEEISSDVDDVNDEYEEVQRQDNMLSKCQSLVKCSHFASIFLKSYWIYSHSVALQFEVKIQDFREARPDVLAHSATNIISRLKSGGEKVSQALKMLCMRQKGIHVEVMW
ncbi:hypothetical protein GW17_00045898 [Ensete ventricosum]|nr:hypothetical protein GW17_00045898 [Ensete ventricosum]RZS00889.1 hypothetical protein BHM03_00030670 [Ensete ventricosum]